MFRSHAPSHLSVDTRYSSCASIDLDFVLSPLQFTYARYVKYLQIISCLKLPYCAIHQFVLSLARSYDSYEFRCSCKFTGCEGINLNRENCQLWTTSMSFPIDRAISGTILPRGERWRSIVPRRLVGGKSTGLSVATLARRPLGPAIGDVWPKFVILRDALERRDDVLRCNITEAFSHPWKTNVKKIFLVRWHLIKVISTGFNFYWLFFQRLIRISLFKICRNYLCWN